MTGKECLFKIVEKHGISRHAIYSHVWDIRRKKWIEKENKSTNSSNSSQRLHIYVKLCQNTHNKY